MAMLYDGHPVGCLLLCLRALMLIQSYAFSVLGAPFHERLSVHRQNAPNAPRLLITRFSLSSKGSKKLFFFCFI